MNLTQSEEEPTTHKTPRSAKAAASSQSDLFNVTVNSNIQSQPLICKSKDGEEEDEQDAEAPAGCCSTLYIFDLFRLYDNRFLFALGLQYLNTGMKSMTTLALLDMFRTQYALEPEETQSLTALMSLSWTPKLFYGIISDTFPIFGTRKKSYLALMGLLQFSTAFLIALYPFENAASIAALGFLMNLASAFMDVVVDGLMVM